MDSSFRSRVFRLIRLGCRRRIRVLTDLRSSARTHTDQSAAHYGVPPMRCGGSPQIVTLHDATTKEPAMLTQERTNGALGLIEVGGRKVGETPRKGEVLEVLGLPGHVHYRVRWEDGHESIFYPGSDTHVRTEARAGLDAGVAEIVDVLHRGRVEFELLPHRRTTSAAAEARALGILPQATAKTVVARLDGQCARVVVPASRRVSPEKLGRALGGRPALLTEAELAGAYPMFELGAVPPIGGPAGDRVVVDGALLDEDYVVLEAGSHEESIRVRSHDLVSITNALVADVSVGLVAERRAT
jgi:Ala-tRNA(Pro) deacylase